MDDNDSSKQKVCQKKKKNFLIPVITTKHLPRRFTNKQTIKKKYKKCNSFVRRTLSFHHVPLLISHPPFRSISPPPHHQYVVCRPSARRGDARTISSKCRCFLVSVLLFWRSYAVASYFLLHFFFIIIITIFWLFFIPLFFMYIFVFPEFLNLGECSCCLHILTSYIFLNFFFFSIFFFSFFVQPVMKIMSSQHSE